MGNCFRPPPCMASLVQVSSATSTSSLYFFQVHFFLSSYISARSNSVAVSDSTDWDFDVVEIEIREEKTPFLF